MWIIAVDSVVVAVGGADVAVNDDNADIGAAYVAKRH